MTDNDWRLQEWEDAIEQTAAENRERFWREAAEAAEYWRRVAAGEIDPGQETSDDCETEDRGEDRGTVPGVPGHPRRPEHHRADETEGVEDHGGVRSTDADAGGGVDGARTDGDMPAEGGGDQ